MDPSETAKSTTPTTTTDARYVQPGAEQGLPPVPAQPYYQQPYVHGYNPYQQPMMYPPTYMQQPYQFPGPPPGALPNVPPLQPTTSDATVAHGPQGEQPASSVPAAHVPQSPHAPPGAYPAPMLYGMPPHMMPAPPYGAHMPPPPQYWPGQAPQYPMYHPSMQAYPPAQNPVMQQSPVPINTPEKRTQSQQMPIAETTPPVQETTPTGYSFIQQAPLLQTTPPSSTKPDVQSVTEPKTTQPRASPVSQQGLSQPVPVGHDGFAQPVPASQQGFAQPLPIGHDGFAQPLPLSEETPAQPLPSQSTKPEQIDHQQKDPLGLHSETTSIEEPPIPLSHSLTDQQYHEHLPTQSHTEQTVHQANSSVLPEDDEVDESAIDDFVSSMRQKLDQFSLEDKVEIIASVMVQLGHDKCIDAIVDVFGTEAVTKYLPETSGE